MNIFVPNSSFPRSELPHKVYEVGRFYNMGESRSKRGTSHILYFHSTPQLTNTLKLGEEHPLGGISYCYVYSAANMIIGILFETPTASTSCSECLLNVVYNRLNCSEYEVQMIFEPIGLLLFRGTAGTLLIIPKEVNSSLLVEVE